MNRLELINGEALSIPGLTFVGQRSRHIPGRFSLICKNDQGAVELWSEPMDSHVASIIGEDSIGGVEIHSPKALYGQEEPDFTDCHVLGGDCWTDGSSLAYSEKFLPLIEAQASGPILMDLAEWHRSHFGGDAR